VTFLSITLRFEARLWLSLGLYAQDLCHKILFCIEIYAVIHSGVGPGAGIEAQRRLRTLGPWRDPTAKPTPFSAGLHPL
jgi:hypothetical protein